MHVCSTRENNLLGANQISNQSVSELCESLALFPDSTSQTTHFSNRLGGGA